MKKILFSPDTTKLLQTPKEEKRLDSIKTYDNKKKIVVNTFYWSSEAHLHQVTAVTGFLSCEEYYLKITDCFH